MVLPLVIKIFLFIFVLISILIPSNYLAVGEENLSLDLSYVVLIDAGSSGTRVHIHPYSITSTSSLPLIYPSYSLKVKPGLSSYIDNPSAAAQSLLPLLQFAIHHVPPSVVSITPIFLYATAGLRTIPLDTAQSILTSCRDLLRQYEFDYSDDHVELISGVEEGINGWIAINYLLNHFSSSSVLPLSPAARTVGVLELGGASFQLTYAPLYPESFPPNHLLPVTVGSATYQVYTISYLNYGLEKAQSLYSEYHYEYIQQHKTDPCYPLEIHPPREHAQGHYDKCVTLVDAIIRQERKEESIHHPLSLIPQTDCNKHACSFGGYWIPPLHKGERFLAIENFFYTSEFFNLLDTYESSTDNNQSSNHSSTSSSSTSFPPFFPLFDLSGLKKIGREFCSLTWPEILHRWPNEPRDDLTKYCFSAAYLPRILELGLALGNGSNYQLVDEIISTDPIKVNDHFTSSSRTNDKEEEKEVASAAADAAAIEEMVESHSGVDPSTPLSPLSSQQSMGESVEISTTNLNDIDINNIYTTISPLAFNKHPRIYITKQINGVTIDWALGAVLQQLVQSIKRKE